MHDAHLGFRKDPPGIAHGDPGVGRFGIGEVALGEDPQFLVAALRQVEQAWLDVLASRPDAYAPSEEQRAMILEALEQVHAMLERLPEKVAEAFLLSQLQGLAYREIAQRMGLSERTIGKYMAQAMYHCLLLEAELDEALAN